MHAEVCVRDGTGMRELWDLEVIGCDAIHRGEAQEERACEDSLYCKKKTRTASIHVIFKI